MTIRSLGLSLLMLCTTVSRSARAQRFDVVGSVYCATSTESESPAGNVLVVYELDRRVRAFTEPNGGSYHLVFPPPNLGVLGHSATLVFWTGGHRTAYSLPVPSVLDRRIDGIPAVMLHSVTLPVSCAAINREEAVAAEAAEARSRLERRAMAAEDEAKRRAELDAYRRRPLFNYSLGEPPPLTATAREDRSKGVPSASVSLMPPLRLDLGAGIASGFTPSTSGIRSLELRASASFGFLSEPSVHFQGPTVAVLVRPNASSTSANASMISSDRALGLACLQTASLCLGATTMLVGVERDFGIQNRTTFRLGKLGVVTRAAPAGSVSHISSTVAVSLDHFWNAPGVENQWVVRGDVGLSGLVVVGPFELEPRVRWLPNLTDLTTDYGIEASLDDFVRLGESTEAGVQLGYAYAGNPSTAYGIDWAWSDKHTAFLRLSLRFETARNEESSKTASWQDSVWTKL